MLEVVKNGNKEYATEIPYSINERRIGTWIDGKPVYIKTVIIQNTDFVTGNNQVAHNINNFKQCIKAELTKGGSNIFPYFNTSGNSFTSTSISNVDSSNITIRCLNDTWGNGNVWYATLYYTKTTD